MAQVVGAIGAITSSVAQVRGLVEQMRDASAQQHQGINQVTQALTQMEQVTQTTAATAEESAAASEELNAQAGAAAEIVQRLEDMVERRAAWRPARPPSAWQNSGNTSHAVLAGVRVARRIG